jgi:hypothetical protein
MRGFFLVLGMAFLLVIHAPGLAANEVKSSELKFAAAFQLPQLPGLSGPSADWRQWDSFFTFVVKRFGQDLSGDLKDSLGEAFLDSRYELTSVIALSGPGQNPVPELFLSGWKRLSPILNKAVPGLPQQTASQYASFISGCCNYHRMRCAAWHAYLNLAAQPIRLPIISTSTRRSVTCWASLLL